MPITVANPPTEKPLIIYDGECDFCRKWIGRCRKLTGERIEYASVRETRARFPEIPESDFAGAVQLVLTNGAVLSGAAAAFKTLAVSGRGTWLFRLYVSMPIFAAASDALYRFIARRRRK